MALLVLLGACSPAAPPLLEEPRLLGAGAFVVEDLEAAASQLTGEPLRDRARLELVDGREEELMALESGWLLQVRRSLPRPDGQGRRDRSMLLHLAAGSSKGMATRIALADSLHLLARTGRGGKIRLLVLERHEQNGQEDVRRLVALDLKGREQVLAEGPVHRLRVDQDRLFLAQAEAAGFVESSDSWHLENSCLLKRGEETWTLGKALPVESPYRALVDFLQAVRGGSWGKAEARCDLRKLLALPGGTHGGNLKASLKAGFPELLDRSFLLKAPARGAIHYLKDLQGRVRWRVEAEAGVGKDGQPRWLLTRLERVVSGS